MRESRYRQTGKTDELADIPQWIIGVGKSEYPFVPGIHDWSCVGKQGLIECAARHSEYPLPNANEQHVHRDHRQRHTQSNDASRLCRGINVHTATKIRYGAVHHVHADTAAGNLGSAPSRGESGYQRHACELSLAQVTILGH